ncbi:MAG: glycosyltransferase [Acidobacteriaceae bacterium]
MRVLQLISSNGFYGAEGVVVLLSSCLGKMGCDATIGLFNASRPQQKDLLRAAKEGGVPVWDLPCSGRFDPIAVARLALYLHHSEIDVLHTHGYKANLYGLLAARLAGCRLIATCHNWTNRNASLHRYAALDKFLLHRFDSVIAVSDTVAEILNQEGFGDSRLRIIPNGIDTWKYRRAAAQPSAEQALVLGALSRLQTEKGIDVLVRALPRIRQQHPRLRCIIAGEGPEREKLLALAAELGVADQLHLPGFCADTAAFLATCTVVAHPSRMDGMPLAVLEAMAAARPIVASAVGSIPALLRDGEAGVLVPPDDSDALAEGILLLLENPGLRSRFAAAASARVAESFDASVMACAYFDAYQELCGVFATMPAPPRVA